MAHAVPQSAAPLGVGEAPALETTALAPTYKIDLRTSPPDVFRDWGQTDWSSLSWERIGRPYRVERFSKHRLKWESEHGREMPVGVQWERFNRGFHELFVSESDRESPRLRREFMRRFRKFNLPGAGETLGELLRIKVWNHIHRVEDAVWDPRGKRALFEGLDLKRPRILFLGAADGYEAMQLLALYPGGEAVLVDYDDFCRTDRFGGFPESYPFLGRDPSTGSWRVWRRDQMEIDFVVDDIRNLKFGREFDIVLSVGLIEHFPDDLKTTAFDFHRRFVKPGGYLIMATPRRQLRSKIFYYLMSDLMNFGYRELMDARQMGLYVHENGFRILRCGVIKAHNGIVAQLR